jgi:hypothetical protein
VLLALAAGLGFAAWHQWSQAETALAEERSANSRRLAIASDQQTDAGHADLGILIARSRRSPGCTSPSSCSRAMRSCCVWGSAPTELA